eukprot:GHVR01092271.1.p1 GENE.GHVR01092271.1~~GHVR01092271.1.p1  ORF type:complete len:580 (+),score=52.24 GHVR01092271.1:120-1859(+)
MNSCKKKTGVFHLTPKKYIYSDSSNEHQLSSEDTLDRALRMLQRHSSEISAEVTDCENTAGRAILKKLGHAQTLSIPRSVSTQTTLTGIVADLVDFNTKDPFLLDLDSLRLLDDVSKLGIKSTSTDDVTNLLQQIRRIVFTTLEDYRTSSLNKPNSSSTLAGYTPFGVSSISSAPPYMLSSPAHLDIEQFFGPHAYHYPLPEEANALASHVQRALEVILESHSPHDLNELTSQSFRTPNDNRTNCTRNSSQAKTDVLKLAKLTRQPYDRKTVFNGLRELCRCYCCVVGQLKWTRKELETRQTQLESVKKLLNDSQAETRKAVSQTEFLKLQKKNSAIQDSNAVNRLYSMLGITRKTLQEINTTMTHDSGPTIDEATLAKRSFGVNADSLPKYSEDVVAPVYAALEDATKKNEELIALMVSGGWNKQELLEARLAVHKDVVQLLMQARENVGMEAVQKHISFTQSDDTPASSRHCRTCGTPNFLRPHTTFSCDFIPPGPVPTYPVKRYFPTATTCTPVGGVRNACSATTCSGCGGPFPFEVQLGHLQQAYLDMPSRRITPEERLSAFTPTNTAYAYTPNT